MKKSFGFVFKRVARDPEIAKTRKPKWCLDARADWSIWSTIPDHVLLITKKEEVEQTLTLLRAKASHWETVDPDGWGMPIATDFEAVELFTQ
jgi:hypothetical protein